MLGDWGSCFIIGTIQFSIAGGLVGRIQEAFFLWNMGVVV